VIVAAAGGLIAGVLPDPQDRLRTLIVSFVFWGIGTPLSWMITTLYFLRLTIHKPLSREVIVSALLPIGPLSLSAFSILTFGKVAKNLLPITHSLPEVAHPGDIIYIISFVVALILWGFAIIWFVIALVMIWLSRPFPFNMGWWGFVFPIGIFTLTTILIGEEFPSRFFKVLGTVLTVACVLFWIAIAACTLKVSITGKMFFSPCLGTDLKLRRLKERKIAARAAEKDMV